MQEKIQLPSNSLLSQDMSSVAFIYLKSFTGEQERRKIWHEMGRGCYMTRKVRIANEMSQWKSSLYGNTKENLKSYKLNYCLQKILIVSLKETNTPIPSQCTLKEVFETGFLCVHLAVLELCRAGWTLDSQRSACLCLCWSYRYVPPSWLIHGF